MRNKEMETIKVAKQIPVQKWSDKARCLFLSSTCFTFPCRSLSPCSTHHPAQLLLLLQLCWVFSSPVCCPSYTPAAFLLIDSL